MNTKLHLALAALALLLALDAPAAAQARVGSIYDPSAGPQGPIANKIAQRAGDLITVVISETQNVRNEEKTDLSKETDLDYQLTNFNVKPNAFSVLPAVTATSDDSFTGNANYEKRGTFSARLTAVVVDALPNGTLIVNGRREIRIDNETKVIEFSGIVRRYDITPDNTVQSEMVANAKVHYTGTGPLTNHTNRSGFGAWLHDAISWIWPF